MQSFWSTGPSSVLEILCCVYRWSSHYILKVFLLWRPCSVCCATRPAPCQPYLEIKLHQVGPSTPQLRTRLANFPSLFKGFYKDKETCNLTEEKSV
jgi:hypothetical protein